MGSEPKRRRWSVGKVAIICVAALVLYVASSGPYFWISARAPMGSQMRTLWGYFGTIYEPLMWLWDYDVQPFGRWLEVYWRYYPERA